MSLRLLPGDVVDDVELGDEIPFADVFALDLTLLQHDGDDLPRAELLREKLQSAVEEYNAAQRAKHRTGKEEKLPVNAEESINRAAGGSGTAGLDYRLASLTININKKDTNVILGDECRILYGNMYITDYIGDVKYRISPLSFYQVNPVQTRRLYSTALEFAGLTGEETVWDLYCGIGTISLFLAQKARKVFGVEIVPQAIDDALIRSLTQSFSSAQRRRYCPQNTQRTLRCART